MILESIANSIPSIMIVNSLGVFFMLVFGILFVPTHAYIHTHAMIQLLSSLTRWIACF